MEHGSPAIRYRLATEVFPGTLTPEALLTLRAEVEDQAAVKQIVRKHKETGVWGGNLLGVSPNKATGVKDSPANANAHEAQAECAERQVDRFRNWCDRSSIDRKIVERSTSPILSRVRRLEIQVSSAFRGCGCGFGVCYPSCGRPCRTYAGICTIQTCTPSPLN